MVQDQHFERLYANSAGLWKGLMNAVWVSSILAALGYGLWRVIVWIFLILCTVAASSQELPGTPHRPQLPNTFIAYSISKPTVAHLPATNKPELGSADWFHACGHHHLAKIIPVIMRVDFNFSYEKPRRK